MKDLENYNDYNILVTGGSGQVGSNLKFQRNNSDFNFFFPTSKELNFLKPETIENYLDSKDFHMIINLAAYTDVDKSEIEKDKSNIINNLALKKISIEANKRNIYLIHSSTDYVFGKKKNAPFDCLDEKNPVNHYGHTKSLGEEQILNNNDKSIIIRFASVYSLYDNNFVKNIIRKLITESVVRVVFDQKISLTYAGDFTSNISSIINLCLNTNKNDNRIFHFVSSQYTDWFSVASIVYDEINKLYGGSLKSKLVPISYKDWQSKTKRPQDSRLIVDNIFLKNNNIFIQPWEDSVRYVVKETFFDILEEIKNEY